MDSKDIGALWSKEKDGKLYMTGVVTIDGITHEIVVFANSYKKDKQPDWRIYKSKPKDEAPVMSHKEAIDAGLADDPNIPF